MNTDDFEIDVRLRARSLTAREAPEPETQVETGPTVLARREHRVGLPEQITPGERYCDVTVEKSVVARLDDDPERRQLPEEVAMPGKNEGMSTSRKVIAGAAVGIAVPAAVGAAKKLMGDGDDKSTRGGSRKSRAKKSSTSSSSPTREQLYKMATRLKIAGRSNMSKSQLQRAVSRAKSRA
jgi:hypothetical protein